MASRNGKKSTGLRMLWIPGRKAHPKGRFDSTSKHISYSTRQKKSEVWSLGGSRNQRDLLEADPDTSLLDGPSTSGLSSIACAAGTTAVAVSIPVADSTKCLLLDAQNTESNTDTLPSAASTQKNNSSENQKPAPTSPTTPNSTTSTAPLLSPPQSPLQQQNETVTITTTTTVTEQPSSSSETLNKMPAKAHQPIPVMVTTTTSAEIMDENRFTLLGKDNITINEFDIYSLPSPPTNPLNSNEHLNSSSGTTASQISSAAGSPQKDGHNNNYHSNNATNSIDSRQLNGSVNSTPVKSKHHHRNHNNNQADVNSIESITEDVTSDKIPATDNLDWIDNMVQDHNDRVILQKPSKKKKNKHATTRQLDQLDGVPHKDTKDASMHDEEEGDKMVKCLYYTLMCCDCSIS